MSPLPPGFGPPGDPSMGVPLAARRPAWKRTWVLLLLAFTVGMGVGIAFAPDDQVDDLRRRLAAAEQRANDAEGRLVATGEPSPEVPTTAPTTPPQVTPSATTRPTPTPTLNPREDDGWQAMALTAGCEFGNWSGTARVRNTNTAEHNGAFTFTLFRNGRIVGTLQGTAQNVETGRTVTVQLGSSDACSNGAYTYEFQTDASF